MTRSQASLRLDLVVATYEDACTGLPVAGSGGSILFVSSVGSVSVVPKCGGKTNSSAAAVPASPQASFPPPLWLLYASTVRQGYFKNTEATQSTVTPDGWLKTGDLCYIDEDGYLFVVDRLKELIKYKGYQVPPAELEALLLTHPEITDVAVIPFPDRVVGQFPMAYVVRKKGSNLSESEVMEFVAKQVAPYKKVRKVAFVTDIPKNASGKILRKDLIKLATSKL